MEIKSNMAGTVLEILALVGDSIEEGQDVVCLESMKMQMYISAEEAGTVQEIKVEAGDFENIALKGDFVISNLIYKDLTMPRVAIPTMNLEFNPKLCNISNAQIELGRSDINLKGYIENPLTLLMDEGEIKSNVQLKGNVFDANEWLEPEASSASNTELVDSSFFVLNLCKRLNISALGSYQKNNL